MRVKIRFAKDTDLDDYTSLLQRTYEDAYTNDVLGLTKECFSKEIFASEDTQRYLKSHLVVNDKQKTWLVLLGSEMIGSITCILINDKEAELTGFYVAPKYQSKGIGKKLYKKVLMFAGDRDLVLDIYTHNKRTIDMYEKWGWRLDKTRGDNGRFFRNWPEWPPELKAECIYMRLVGFQV